MQQRSISVVDAALEALPLAHPEIERVVIAYSGGPDSTALLWRAARVLRTRWAVSAIHVHHGLDADADSWTELCRTNCARLDVPLSVRRVTVDSRDGGPEAAARTARYDALAQHLVQYLAVPGEGRAAILLAHHREDQAETFLTAALRGSGITGLAAMPAARSIGVSPSGSPIRLLRPLLDVARQDLVAVADASGLEVLQDPMNDDPARMRAVLRHQVFPALEANRAGAARTLARSARLAAEAEEALDWFAARWLAGFEQSGEIGPLPVERLTEVPRSVRAALLRCWLRRQGASMPPEARLAELLRQCAARPDGDVAVAWGEFVVRRFSRMLYLDAALEPPPTVWARSWRGEALALPSGAGVLRLAGAEVLAEPLRSLLYVRFRRGGEQMRVSGRRSSASLKRLLQDAGVPPWERRRLPLVFVGDELAAAGTLVFSQSWQERLEPSGVRLVHERSTLDERLTLARADR